MSSSAILERLRGLLDNTQPFDRLPENVRAEVLSDVSLEYFGAGDVVIEQRATAHRGLYIVESGLVRLMDLERQRLIDKCGEGDTFGSFALVKGGVSIYEAKAVEPTVCALVSAERFQKLFSAFPEFSEFYQSDIVEYVRRMGSTKDVAGAHLLFSRSLNQFVHLDLTTAEADTTAQQAARILKKEGSEALLVLQHDKIAGVVTTEDFRDKLAARGLGPDTPVRRLMSPAVTIASDARIYDAMVMMLEERARHLVITRREGGEMVPEAILSDRDIAHFRGQDPLATVFRIDSATSVSELVSIRAQTNDQLLNLYRQGAHPEMVNRVMTVFYDRLAVRVLEVTERSLRAKSGPRSDLPWAWVRLGSGGRQEMALNSQQHNALIFANPPDKDEAELASLWFDRLSEEANAALEACGFAPSDYIARDPQWRLSLKGWKQLFRSWILQADEAGLKKAPLFFDLRGIYGDLSLVDDLKQDIEDALNVEAMDEDRRFLNLMASNALRRTPPISFFRRFVVERSGEHRNSLDLREGGILPVVDAARLLALEIRYLDASSTFVRLRRAAEAVPELDKVIEGALEAYHYLVDFRLEHQLRAVEAGDQPGNHIEPGSLNKMQQRLLRKAFSRVSDLQDALARRHEVQRRWLS